MGKTKEKQPIPKWFKGEIYKKGGTVRNPYSGCLLYTSPSPRDQA